MTFYNVISGILFFAAFRAFLATLGTDLVWYTIAILATILSDTVSTSNLTECRADPIDYTFEEKLLDFVTFGLLSWALLCLIPGIYDELNPHVTLWGSDKPHVFWSLLAIDWEVALLWNRLAQQNNSTLWKPWYINFTYWRPLPFVALALASDFAPGFAVAPRWYGILGATLALFYFLIKLPGRQPKLATCRQKPPTTSCTTAQET